MTDITNKINKITKFVMGLAVAVCILVTGCGEKKETLFLDEQSQETADIRTSETQEETAETEAGKVTETAISTMTPVPEEIYVDVCGAVANPGVYKLDPDSRVFQAIEAAGGLSVEAAGYAVNQAQSVSDGQQIYVPTREEAEQGTIVLPMEDDPSGNSGQQETGSDKVNLNTADADTLKTLSGIGEAKAQAIIAWREENGRFSSIEDIMQVPGIKESTFVKFKDKVTIE